MHENVGTPTLECLTKIRDPVLKTFQFSRPHDKIFTSPIVHEEMYFMRKKKRPEREMRVWGQGHDKIVILHSERFKSQHY